MYPQAGKIFWSRKNIYCWYIVEKWFFVRIILYLWWIEMITKPEQKNGAIKRKHEIKHGVEAAKHQRCSSVWITFFKGPFIIYACIDSVMMWWNLLDCPIIPSFDACEWSGTMVKISQVSISSLLHIAPPAQPGQHRVLDMILEMIYWLSWQCWHPLYFTRASSHTTCRHAFNPPSHNLINGGPKFNCN